MIRKSISCGCRSHDGQSHRVRRAQGQPQLLLCITGRHKGKVSISWEDLLRSLKWLFVYWFCGFLQDCEFQTWMRTWSHAAVLSGWLSPGGHLWKCSAGCLLGESRARWLLSPDLLPYKIGGYFQRSVNIYNKRVITMFSLCFYSIFFIYSIVYGTKLQGRQLQKATWQ